MFFRLSLFISGLALMAGCAAPQIPLTKNVQRHMDSAENILFIPQNNLDITVTPTNPGGGGLIGALVCVAIDSSRRSSAKKESAPIIQQLQNYNFRTVMLKALSHEIPKVSTIKFELPIRLETVDSNSQQRISFDKSKASVVVFTRVNYRLESGNLIVNASVKMYPKTKKLSEFRKRPNDSNPISPGNSIYRKFFTFTKQAITAKNIRGSLFEGASSLAKQIVADLNHPL